MNVLSLFDGIGCARLALDLAKIKYKNYFSSETDKYCIEVLRDNYPDSIFLGDVKKINLKKLPKIDLLIGGSPCQDISNAHAGVGIKGLRSSLFFEFVKIQRILKPKFFLLENVKSKWKDYMSEQLDTDFIEINSSYFHPQNRPRLYWTNFSFELPRKNSNLAIQDILEKNVPTNFFLEEKIVKKIISHHKIEKRNGKDIRKLFTIEKKFINDNERQRRLYSIKGKSPTLLARSDTPKILVHNKIRKLTPLECERLQGIKDNYTEMCSNTQRFKMIGNSFSVGTIAYILKNMNKNKPTKRKQQLDLNLR